MGRNSNGFTIRSWLRRVGRATACLTTPDDVSDDADGVPYVTDGVLDVAAGVSDVTDGVPDVTNDVSDVTDDGSDLADGVPDVADGVPDVALGVPDDLIARFYEADALPRNEFVNSMTISRQPIGLIASARGASGILCAGLA